MSNLLEGKLALVLGIANRWSLAYAVAQAYAREGATLVLTSLLVAWNLPSVILECFWGAISVYGLMRSLRA